MKKIKNKLTDLNNPESCEKDCKMSYSDLMKVALDQPPPEGWTPSVMGKRFKIEDKIKEIKIDSMIELEDADHSVILECIQYPWGMKHRDLFKFFEDVKSVK